ncbi:uridine kinase [Bacillus sp. HNG]|uniref:uridine kinase family protein n=1 Tax=Bacillus sp. HNG TaxID=2293325 RepID=UPI00167693D3|nr:uridine kinase [Bacillus sp. HNG]
MGKVNYLTDYIPVLETIKKINELDKPIILAIDGRCGSGKSGLAEMLKQEVDSNVFHMDDFFLPFDMKTKERLTKPGENVHYERFNKEVLTPLLQGKKVIHQPYNCQIREFDQPIHTEPKKLTIVEGSYCMHPSLQPFYDIKIFMTINKEIQLERIRKRNGEERLQDFNNKWIPMEELYFSELNIEDKCDFTIDTSNIW